MIELVLHAGRDPSSPTASPHHSLTRPCLAACPAFCLQLLWSGHLT